MEEIGFENSKLSSEENFENVNEENEETEEKDNEENFDNGGKDFVDNADSEKKGSEESAFFRRQALRVFCRIRPQSEESKELSCLEVGSDNKTICLQSGEASHQFRFAKIFHQYTLQQEVFFPLSLFDNVCASFPILYKSRSKKKREREKWFFFCFFYPLSFSSIYCFLFFIQGL